MPGKGKERARGGCREKGEYLIEDTPCCGVEFFAHCDHQKTSICLCVLVAKVRCVFVCVVHTCVASIVF